MEIVLGNVTLDRACTTVLEHYEEVGGRDARHVTLSGVIIGMSTVEAVEARLDAILTASSLSDGETPLSLRSDRRLLTRRLKYTREVSSTPIAGSFVLELEAVNPFEESMSLREVSWSITETGSTLSLTTSGNVFAQPKITLVAQSDLVSPAFSDGRRQIMYEGRVRTGQVLVLNGTHNEATLDDEDVTPYTRGLFPHLDPAGTILRYEDGASSSHMATATIAFHDRWW